jgi:hypothetical protein
LENLLRRRHARPANTSAFPELLPGAGEGIRTPDPLITNQMLYQLSYASDMGQVYPAGRNQSLDPFPFVGTTIKVTITAIYVQPPHPPLLKWFSLSESANPFEGFTSGKCYHDLL